jgi:hypothetical protein
MNMEWQYILDGTRVCELTDRHHLHCRRHDVLADSLKHEPNGRQQLVYDLIILRENKWIKFI